MQKLDPGSCFIDAAEAPILRIFWNKIAPKGGPTCRPYGSSGTWIFLNEITPKRVRLIDPTDKMPVWSDLSSFLLSCYKPWNQGKV